MSESILKQPYYNLHVIVIGMETPEIDEVFLRKLAAFTGAIP